MNIWFSVYHFLICVVVMYKCGRSNYYAYNAIIGESRNFSKELLPKTVLFSAPKKGEDCRPQNELLETKRIESNCICNYTMHRSFNYRLEWLKMLLRNALSLECLAKDIRIRNFLKDVSEFWLHPQYIHYVPSWCEWNSKQPRVDISFWLTGQSFTYNHEKAKHGYIV